MNKKTSLLNAHDEMHFNHGRRDFLSTLGIAGGIGLGLGKHNLFAMASPLLTTINDNERILVLVRLKGGNDGLNTIIPVYDYGTYKNNRPNIHIKQNDLINLSSEFAIPKTMNSLLPLWNEGSMKVVNSVGYDNHNLSHFTSSDIWNSANTNIESTTDQSGWLGRYLENQNPDYLNNLPQVPGAIKISSGSSIAYYNKDKIDLAVNFNSASRLLEISEKGYYFDTTNLPDDCTYGDQIGYLRKIMNLTYQYAPAISKAYKNAENQANYKENELSRQLAIVARLIKGRLGTKLYMVTLDGFDTHENQNQDHPKLVNYIAESISEFYNDLKIQGFDQKVLTMTFSEFGRRLKENTGGTDHGTASPVLMFGPALNGNGFVGQATNLEDLDQNNNLKHHTDFRSVYASLLESWLCIKPDVVNELLNDNFERLPLGIDCSNVATYQLEKPIAMLQHKVYPSDNNTHTIEITIKKAGKVKAEIYSLIGTKIYDLGENYLLDGSHKFQYTNQNAGSYSTLLIYRISYFGKTYSGKFFV